MRRATVACDRDHRGIALRLALTGRSVGGYFTLLGLEHDPDLWRVGISIVGVFDVEAMMQTTEGDLRSYWEKKEMAPLADPMILAALSPSTYVERIKTPLLVYAAANDVRAPKK